MADAVSNPGRDVVDQPEAGSEPKAVVEKFLELLESGKVEEATELLATDVVYENVGLPTVHGRSRVQGIFQAATRIGVGVEAYLHTVSADGPSVMTERTDVIKFRRLHIQLWVCGRFDVRDRHIVLWRDYFDFANFTLALVRGLAGAVLPAMRAKPPTMGRV